MPNDSVSVMSHGWLYELCVLLIAAFAGHALPAASSPMVHPNLARGDNAIFHNFGYDRVNTFNGNLRIDIPIGLSYPLASHFSYQLKLSYNSNAWDLAQNEAGTVLSTQPMVRSNSGMGWDLSFGRLIPPDGEGNTLRRWIYVSPDGQMRPFYDKLHPGEPALTVAPGVFYTRDGSYIRLSKRDGSAVVEMPDGVAKTFVLDSEQNRWLLTKIADPFDNHVALTHDTSGITIADSHGRTHRIDYFVDSTGVYGNLVDKVTVSAFGGSFALYDLTYKVVSVTRPVTDNDPATSSAIEVPVLTAVQLPDGTQYTFDYAVDTPTNGRLSAMSLPTLGGVEWEYGKYWLPRGIDKCQGGDLPKVLHINGGVKKRHTRDIAGNVEGTWIIGQVSYGTLGGTSGGRQCFPGVVTNVIFPTGDRHRYLYSVATGPATGGDPSTYGMPIQAGTEDSEGRAVSERVNDCASGGAACELVRTWRRRYEQDAPANPLAFDGMQVNRREISQRVQFHDDGNRFADINLSDFDGLGHYRVSETKGNFGSADYVQRVTDYDAATGTYPGSGWSKPDYDEPWILNTFRQTLVTNGAETRVVDYCFDKSTGFQLRKRLRVSASAPTNSDAITLYLDDGDGNFSEERYFGGDVQVVGSHSDLCSAWLPAPQYRIRHEYQHGMLASSRYLDESGAGFGPPFLDRSIDPSTGLTSQQRNSAGIATNITYDKMGRATWVKPAAGHGAWQQYNYIRATGAVTSQHAQVRHYAYPNGGGGPGYLTRTNFILDGFGRIEQKQTWMPGDRVAKSLLEYGAMGWLARESMAFFSGDPVKWKQYLDRDPFGRARIERPPTGSIDDVTFEYLGVRIVRRTESEAVYHNNGTIVRADITTESVYDRLGRLWKRITGTNPVTGAPSSVTEYRRDLAGRLLESLYDGERMGVAREFDARGFIAKETTTKGVKTFTAYDALGQPRQYRAIWSAEWHSNVLATPFDLVNVYDDAGRLVQVRAPGSTTSPVLLQEFRYANANGTGDFRAGKLVEAKYHFDFSAAKEFGGDNYVLQNQGTVAERYTYGGPGGRISRHEVEFTSDHPYGGVYAHRVTATTYAYDELGNTTAIAYPPSSWRSRTVGRQFERDRLVRIDGSYVGNVGDTTTGSELWGTIAYHANGMVSAINYGNGTTFSTTLDAAMNRFDSTSVTGTFFYGSGDAIRQAALYDGRGALVRYSDAAHGTQYLIPEGPYYYDNPPPPDGTPPPDHDCGGHYGGFYGLLDPLGRQIAFIYKDPWGQCKLQVSAYYYPSGYPYRIENNRRDGSDSKTTLLRDFEGRVLTKLKYLVSDAYTLTDFVYGANGLFGVFEIHQYNGDETRFIHPTIGGAYVTDRDGKRVSN